MNRSVLYTLLTALLVLTVSLYANGQSREQLEKQRQQLEQSIQFNTQQLQKIGANKKQSLSQLELLVTQINTREKVITNISSQISVIDGHIKENEGIVKALNVDIKNLKDRYAEMVYYAYKHRSTINDIIFVFSATSFNDAIRRLRYLDQISQFRKRQVELITLTKESLSKRIGELEGQRKDQQKLLDQQVSQREQLQAERNQRNSLVADLKKKENKLMREIEKQRKNAELLSNKIADVIAEQQRIAELNAKKNNATSGYYAALSNQFSENKGKFPMPVDKGVIVSSFGPHPHPVYGDKLIENNKGIDIRTTENAPVHVIFDGEVVSIFSIPGYQRAVLVKHGEYITAYSKLNTVTVSVGDKVKTGQSIGTAYTDTDNADTEVHFELWKGTNNLNPALWIYKQ